MKTPSQENFAKNLTKYATIKDIVISNKIGQAPPLIQPLVLNNRMVQNKRFSMQNYTQNFKPRFENDYNESRNTKLLVG